MIIINTLKFGRHIGSIAANMPAKFQSDWTTLNENVEIWKYFSKASEMSVKFQDDQITQRKCLGRLRFWNVWPIIQMVSRKVTVTSEVTWVLDVHTKCPRYLHDLWLNLVNDQSPGVTFFIARVWLIYWKYWISVEQCIFHDLDSCNHVLICIQSSMNLKACVIQAQVLRY